MKTLLAVGLSLLLNLNPAHAEWVTTYGNQVTALRTGDLLNKKRLEIIEQAQHFVYLKTFIINKDETEAPVYEALCRRAKEIDVRMLVDDLGRRQGGNPIDMKNEKFSIEWFRECGVKFERSKTLKWGLITLVLFNQHDKALTSDVGSIMGGTNFSRDYSQHGQLSPLWYDFDILIHGPAACAIQDIFVKSWIAVHDKTISLTALERRRQEINERFNVEGLHRQCHATGLEGHDRLTTIFNNPYFSDARPFEYFIQESLKIVSNLQNKEDKIVRLYAPYFVPTKETVQKMVDAVKAGVTIKIITNSNDSVDPEAYAAYAAMLQRAGALLEGKVEIYLWDPVKNALYPNKKDNVLHKKGGCFSTGFCFVGSHNMDVRGDRYSSEMMTVIENQDFVGAHIRSFDDDLKFTTRLTVDTRRPLLKSVRLGQRAIAKLLGWAL